MLHALMLIIIAAQPICLDALSQRAELQGKLDRPVENYTVSALDFPRALAEVALQYDIPIGIEWIQLPTEPETVVLSWKHTTVRGLIEKIVKSRPGYQLEVGDQIIRVWYEGALSDKSNFLNIKIPEFEVRDEHVAFAEQKLEDIVKPIVSPPPPSHGPRSMVRETVVGGGDNKSRFRLENAAVREILERLALATDAQIWVVTFKQSMGETSTGFRRTIALSTPYYVPNDAEQPVWDLIFVRNTEYLRVK